MNGNFLVYAVKSMEYVKIIALFRANFIKILKPLKKIIINLIFFFRFWPKRVGGGDSKFPVPLLVYLLRSS